MMESSGMQPQNRISITQQRWLSQTHHCSKGALQLPTSLTHQDFLLELAHSMPRRLRMVIEANGETIPY
ncbi:hypothetical protein VTK56DRAFT_981 [Thermocarpiscus australiensis]